MRRWCSINPVLLEADGEAETKEGCLSIPDVYESRASRPSHGARGGRWTATASRSSSMPTGCWRPASSTRSDHLEGRLFVDYLSPLKRNRIRKRMEKRLRDGPEDEPAVPA